MNKEINSVAEAVPVIMEARGYYYNHWWLKTGVRYGAVIGINNTEAEIQCCSLDVLAKEIWAKQRNWRFKIDFFSGKSNVEIMDMWTEETIYETANTINEAACIATARALVALTKHVTPEEK